MDGWVQLALVAVVVLTVLACIEDPPPTPGEQAAEDQYRAEAEENGW